jgi:hypothetical protein
MRVLTAALRGSPPTTKKVLWLVELMAAHVSDKGRFTHSGGSRPRFPTRRGAAAREFSRRIQSARFSLDQSQKQMLPRKGLATIMISNRFAFVALLPLVIACSGPSSSADTSEGVDSAEQAATSAWSRVLFTGSFHLGTNGGSGSLGGGAAGVFDVSFVEEVSNIDIINAGHGGDFTQTATWNDPVGLGSEIHFSPNDLGTGGGMVIWSPGGGKIKGSWSVDYWCVNTTTGYSTKRNIGGTHSGSGAHFFPFNCDDGEQSSFFTGGATVHKG